ncbi:MAG: AAA family ATPase, partial [Planctomycetota bacterium]
RARPDDPAWEDPTCTVTVLSGLPGAGKDTWVREHRPDLPVVSLDRIRARLGVAPTDNQGTVIQAAREEARTHLRAKRDFVWNATNVTRQVRRMPIGLCAQYGARVEIVAIETTSDALFKQNRSRTNAVPDTVLSNLIRKWEAPDSVEAHAVHWYDA